MYSITQVVSGLVILEQSGPDSSFSGLLASPCVPFWYRRLTCVFDFFIKSAVNY